MKIRFLRILTATTGAILTIAALLQATPEYSKKENVGCEFCHTGVGKADLNEAGKYYKEHNHSLKGYVPKKRF
jgi:hypothetical protein